MNASECAAPPNLVQRVVGPYWVECTTLALFILGFLLLRVNADQSGISQAKSQESIGAACSIDVGERDSVPEATQQEHGTGSLEAAALCPSDAVERLSSHQRCVKGFHEATVTRHPPLGCPPFPPGGQTDIGGQGSRTPPSRADAPAILFDNQPLSEPILMCRRAGTGESVPVWTWQWQSQWQSAKAIDAVQVAQCSAS